MHQMVPPLRGTFPGLKEGMSSTSTSPGRILVVAPQPFYEDRGTPIAVKHVIEALLQCGNLVDLLTYPVGKPIELAGLRTFRIRNPFGIRHVPIGFSIRKLLLDIVLIPAIWRRLRRESYGCIHALEEAAFPAVLAGRWQKVPVIYDMQSSLPAQMEKHLVFRQAAIQKALRVFERWLIRRADFVVCSAGLEEYVRHLDPSVRVREWQFPSQRVDVSFEEVKRLRERLQIATSTCVVLYSGTFEPYQGLSRLVDAACKVLSLVPNTVFVLVGANGSADLSLSGAATGLCQRGALKILPRQARSMIPRFLAMADVVVSPRVGSGNLPLKIFDYMAAGRPIVAMDSPAHRTVLDDKRAVLVGESVGELGEAIAGLLHDRERAQGLGAAAQAYAEKNLGWRAFVELVSHVHTRALGRGRRSRSRETHSDSQTAPSATFVGAQTGANSDIDE